MPWQSTSNRPSVTRLPIGEIVVSSGCLLLADPQYIEVPLAVEHVPVGKSPVTADVIYDPRGSPRVAKVLFQFGGLDDSPLKEIGHIPVDSAKMVAIDRQAYETCWQKTGPDRIGVIPTPGNKAVVALLKKHFNLDCVQINAVRAEVIQPVPLDVEERINELLRSIPEYAQFSFMHFYVQTNDTFDKVNWMPDPWGTIVLDGQSDTSLLAFNTGYGDGTYRVFGRFNNGVAAGLEIMFIEDI
jgi:hypothetical protein